MGKTTLFIRRSKIKSIYNSMIALIYLLIEFKIYSYIKDKIEFNSIHILVITLILITPSLIIYKVFRTKQIKEHGLWMPLKIIYWKSVYSYSIIDYRSVNESYEGGDSKLKLKVEHSLWDEKFVNIEVDIPNDKVPIVEKLLRNKIQINLT